jgi:hypothetical protein
MSRLAIADLFEEFNLSDVPGFHRLEPGLRPIFISRLYKALAATYESSLQEIRSARGLKLHFASRAERGGLAGIFPSESFLKKIAFYSSRTLITFPFHEVKSPEQLRRTRPVPAHRQKKGLRHDAAPLLFGQVVTRRTAAGGEVQAVGKAYAVDPTDFDDFLSLLLKARPALAAGVVTVLPVFHDTHQLILRYRDGMLPAAFQLSTLKQQFEELASEPVAGLYLPTCSDLPFETILGLRRREEAAYQSFQHNLAQLLHAPGELNTESKLLQYLEEVHHGIAELNRKFMDARKHMFLYQALPAAGLAFLLTPLGAHAAIAALKGYLDDALITALTYPYLDYRKTIRDLRQERCYLPWRIYRARKRWFA